MKLTNEPILAIYCEHCNSLVPEDQYVVCEDCKNKLCEDCERIALYDTNSEELITQCPTCVRKHIKKGIVLE